MLIILLIVEAAILFLYIYSLFINKKIFKKSNSLYSIPILLVIYSLYLYAAIYNQEELHSIDFLTYLNSSLKVFAFEYKKDFLEQCITNNFLFKIDFYIAFFMAAFTSITVISSLFFSAIETALLMPHLRKKGFDVVIGNSEASINYIQRTKNCVLWCQDANKESLIHYRSNNIKYFNMALTAKGFNRIVKNSNKKVNFIYLDEDCMTALNEFNNYIIKHPSKTENVFFYVNTAEYGDLINNLYHIKNEKSPRIVTLNKYSIIASKFIFENPMTKYMDKKEINYDNGTLKINTLNTIFVGFGQINQEIYLKMYSNNQFVDENLNPVLVNYYAFDCKNTKYNKKFNSTLYSKKEFGNNNSYFDLPQYNENIELNVMDINDIKFFKSVVELLNKDGFSNIIISYDNDMANLDLAFKIKNILLEHSIRDFHIFVRIENSDNITDTTLNDSFISYFGEDDTIINHNCIVNESITELARIRANKYVDSKDAKAFNQSLYEWNKLDLLKKESNIASSLSVTHKLNLIGLDIVKNQTGLSKDEYLKYYLENDSLIYGYDSYDFNRKSRRNVLAIIEHLRWTSFYISKGYGPYKKNDLGFEITNDKYIVIKDNNILKTHACIASIKGLDEYHKYIAEKLYDLDTDHKLFKSYEACLDEVETYKYDLQMMDQIYDSITKLGYSIVKREDYMEIKESKKFELVYPYYRYDFPPCEQKSNEKVKEMIKSGKYHLYLSYEDELKGYLLAYKNGDKFLWMDYFATIEKFRGTGVGSRFLTKMAEKYGAIIFEVEISDGIEGSETYNREKFYKRLGAKKLDVPYELPTSDGSLSMNLFILTTKDYDLEELRSFIKEAVSFIHSDYKHTPEVIKKYIDKLK